MTPLRFSFVLHIHQPVGNFDHVFRDHADDVYTPFFDFLEERELWPIGLHVSGPLLEWMGEHAPEVHDRIGRFVDDGRIELLSAGWYEPILAALPRADRAEQLGWMREELERRFGFTPTGLWLTERVWEPDLPADLADAGIEYVLIDDHLARRAGVAEGRLQQRLRTEADGRYVDLLTIDERLRYLIPFRPADEIAAELRLRQERGDTLALIGDDGEKFGGWPRTKEWLYEGGWLRAFGDRMDELRGDGIVKWVTPSQARAELPSTGPVYLPTGSYPEMEEWALGGHWKGFLARYPESNRMHKRMLALSALSRERGDPVDVRRAIGRAQCNDAYWHGVFGGLYMKHLREGVRRQMMTAERLLRAEEALTWSRTDVDGDGRDEWWAHGASVSAWITEDGFVTDLLWLDGHTDVIDVLTRYREAYHDEALHRGGSGEAGQDDATEIAGQGGSAPSIHEIEGAAVLRHLPPQDTETRCLVRERILPADESFGSYAQADFAHGTTTLEWGVGVAPTSKPGPYGTQLTWSFQTTGDASVGKRLILHEDGTVDYEWAWNPDAFSPDAFFSPEVSLGSPVDLTFEPEAETWRYPIITVSKCPDGFEEIEQGTSVTPRWPVSAGRARMTIRIAVAGQTRLPPGETP